MFNDEIQEMYKTKQITHEEALHLKGYAACLEMWGIWSNGVQVIGALRIPISKAFQDYLRSYLLN